jgi:hypothetical protein
MEIGVLVLIEGNFHTQHIYRKEDLAKIAGAYLIIEVSGLMKADVIWRTNNTIVESCIKEV